MSCIPCYYVADLPHGRKPMQDKLPFLVYRDRIGVPSEVSFLRRQYVGFARLQPVWIGRALLPSAPVVADRMMRLGGDGPLGGVRRLLFRHIGWVPPFKLPTLADAGMHAATCDDTLGLAPMLHAQFARGGALALPLARALGSRMVVTLHGGDISKQKNWRHGSVLARRWPALLQEVANFVCVSAAVAEIAAARGVSAAKLIVLPIGVEVSSSPPAAVSPDAHLFVGRFVEKKGISVLADAVRRLRASGDPTPLICIGDGPLRPLLESLAREVPGITLTGWLDPEAIRPRLANACSLLVPSIVARDGDAEGLPSVIPEAMTQACPVIGSDQGGIAEAVQHNRTGLLVPPNDAQALAAAMRRIVTEPGLRGSLGAQGFAVAASSLNARLQSAKLEALLLSVAAGAVSQKVSGRSRRDASPGL
jgi:colanic acid/amylovoran biosynthesis glycosyltransferase